MEPYAASDHCVRVLTAQKLPGYPFPRYRIQIRCRVQIWLCSELWISVFRICRIRMFWVSWIRIRILNLFVPIRILPSTSKKRKKNLDFYCFVTSLWLFIFEDDENVPSKRNKHCWRFEGHWRKEQDPEPDPLVKGTDPRIRIRTKMSRIRNIALSVRVLYWHLL